MALEAGLVAVQGRPAAGLGAAQNPQLRCHSPLGLGPRPSRATSDVITMQRSARSGMMAATEAADCGVAYWNANVSTSAMAPAATECG